MSPGVRLAIQAQAREDGLRPRLEPLPARPGPARPSPSVEALVRL